MILRETKEEKIKDYALDIQNAGQNLLALINDILDFSKIESGKLEILPIEYDFSSLIHDISNMLKLKAKAKNLKLEFFVDPKIPSKLLGDDVRIRQVLVNLLNNAVKYTTQGSVRLRVEGHKEERKVLLGAIGEKYLRFNFSGSHDAGNGWSGNSSQNKRKEGQPLYLYPGGCSHSKCHYGSQGNVSGGRL